MNWQMWLLVSLLVSILVILIALAIVLYFQNRLIGSLNQELKKSLESYVALEKSFQRSLERHSERVVGTNEYLKTMVANAESVASHHENEARVARAELEKAHSEIKKYKSILARKDRQAARIVLDN